MKFPAESTLEAMRTQARFLLYAPSSTKTEPKLFTKKYFGRIISWLPFTSTPGTISRRRFAIRLTGFRTVV
jgi:hypothetical protein